MEFIAGIFAVAAAFGIPAAATGFFIRRFEKRLDTRETEKRKEEQQVEAARKKSMVLVINGTLDPLASGLLPIALGEATAKAVQRIPDARCNGDMEGALEYAKRVKHEQKDFLTEQASENLF